ncbi:hypothetical protein FACS1894116_04830 [Betaproteobacteria bacterium]|nr:hypothetical protein FACS1894116_04830 [Betaproteobacteria bacterium]GHT97668.1 hypothetical protein FACS1894154_01540 [Betaproteobacteria bacterium]GHU28347.1 hypothetical protein FACS189497_03600 [Betaproteobacteria bacterium]
MFTKPKLLSCLAFALTVLCTPLVQAANYSGVWWNPTLSGMGFNFLHEGNTVAVTWYHYDDNSNSTFLNLSGNLNGTTLSGKLYRSHGTPPGPLYNASAITTTEVGSATLTFNSDNQATFAYNYDGKQGSFSVERFGFGDEKTYNVNLEVNHYGFGCGSSAGKNFVAQGTLRVTMHADGRFTVVSPSGYTYEQHPGAANSGTTYKTKGTVTGHGRTSTSTVTLDQSGDGKDFTGFSASATFGNCILNEETTTSMTRQ